MRNMSEDFRKEFYAPQTGEALITLLKVFHAESGVDLRLCNNHTDIVHNGETFSALNFRIMIPPDTEEGMPKVSLSIDNVDRQIVHAARTVHTPMNIEMAIVLSNDVNTVEMGWFEFLLRNVRYDRYTVSGDLWYEDVMNDRFPKDEFIPSLFPGLF